MSSDHRVTPAASAASTVAASSSTRLAAASSTRGRRRRQHHPGQRPGEVGWPATARPPRRRCRCVDQQPVVAGRQQQHDPRRAAQHPTARCPTPAKPSRRTPRHPRGPARRSVPPTPARRAARDRTPPVWPARWSRPAPAPAPWPPLRPSRTGPRCCRRPRRAPRGRRRRTVPDRPGARRPAASVRLALLDIPDRCRRARTRRAQSRTNSRAANCSSVTVATTCTPRSSGNGAAETHAH